LFSSSCPIPSISTDFEFIKGIHARFRGLKQLIQAGITKGLGEAGTDFKAEPGVGLDVYQVLAPYFSG
jgi:hypothetical protein